MRKVLLLIIALFLISFVGAEQQPQCDSYISPAELGSCKVLVQTCENCTYVNITSVYYPAANGSILNLNHGMTKFVNTFNYSFCANNALGQMMYSTIGDLNGQITQGNVCYEVTGSGNIFSEALSIPIFLPIIIMLLISLGFFIMAFYTIKPEYKFTLIIFAGLFLILSVAFGIAASREIFGGFTSLYAFVNAFYRIFITGSVVVGFVAAVAVAFFVIRRAFNTKGYNLNAEYMPGK